MQALNITYDVLTSKGGRKVNEDYLGAVETPNRLGFVLCDGLGGHGRGDAASQFVVTRMQSTLKSGKSIEESILDAQKGLLQKQADEHAETSMKTTVTCLTLEGAYARFGHVGDSRIYYFEKGKYKLRSQDHSVPQMLVMRGDIKEKDIRHHEDRSRLLCVMGTPWSGTKFKIVDNIILTEHTTFLLCSDGFWELVDEKTMCKTLKVSKTPGEWLKKMEQVILKNGINESMDNYSAIAVFVRKG